LPRKALVPDKRVVEIEDDRAEFHRRIQTRR
jgi:hypothetical protein